jgi:PPE family
MGAQGMSDIRWEGFTHDEIYARVQQGPGRAASADAEAAWSTVESTIRAVDEQLTRAVRQVGAGWQGAAAERVHGGMNVMSNWALDAAGDALLTKHGIAAQAEEAGHVRAAMPPPHTAKWNDTVGQVVAGAGLVPGMTDIGPLEDQMANDRARAVELMNQYSARSSENRQMMNYWTQPPTVVVETVAPASTSGAATVSLAGIGTGHTTSSAMGSPATPADVAGQVGVPVPAPAGGSDPPGAGARMDAGPGMPSATNAAGSASAVPATAWQSPSSASNPTTGADRTAAPGLVPVVPTPGTGPSSTGRVPASRPGLDTRPSASSSARPHGTDLPNGVRPVVPGPPSRSASGEAPLPGRVPGPGVPAEPVPRPSHGVPRESPGTWRATSVEPGVPAATSSRGVTPTGHGIIPMGGVGRPADQEHRRPDYLIDDTDAFADDRWFTPPVIGGDDNDMSRV